MAAFYTIRVKGQLNPCWTEWLDGLNLTCLDCGETQLASPLPDQFALYGILKWIRDMNLEWSSCRKRKNEQ
jgi:hypothetical protein